MEQSLPLTIWDKGLLPSSQLILCLSNHQRHDFKIRYRCVLHDLSQRDLQKSHCWPAFYFSSTFLLTPSRYIYAYCNILPRRVPRSMRVYTMVRVSKYSYTNSDFTTGHKTTHHHLESENLFNFCSRSPNFRSGIYPSPTSLMPSARWDCTPTAAEGH